MKPDVTVIIPAYNEEGNIAAAVASVGEAVKNTTSDYEIIVVNDGSTDTTGVVAERLAKMNRHIRVAHHNKNMGMGHAYQTGLSLARKTFVTVFPGDNDMASISLARLIGHAGKQEMIVGYNSNPQRRTLARRILSKLFIVSMNALFRLKLRYYTGPFLSRTELVRSLHAQSDGIIWLAEVKIRAVLAGHSVLQVPFENTRRAYGKSKAITWRSFRQTAEATASLVATLLFKRSPAIRAT